MLGGFLGFWFLVVLGVVGVACGFKGWSLWVCLCFFFFFL